MTKTVTLIAGCVFLAASAAQAQSGSLQPETGAYVTLGAGGQAQKRSFGTGGTFTSFSETGRYQMDQNIGAAMMFDIGGGYKFSKHLAVGVSVWNARSESAAAAAAALPDPLYFGRFATLTAGNSDLKQTTFGANVFVTYTTPVANRMDLAVSLGPTIVRTKLDVGSVTVAPGSQKIDLAANSQSKTSARAGNVGLDLSYRITDVYSVGVFARYAGGEVELPIVNKLKVGGVQTGGLIRYRF